MSANLKSASSSSDPQPVVVICRLGRQINGLKSITWATHYPPANPLSRLAPPKLHINLEKFITTWRKSLSHLHGPAAPVCPIKPKCIT